MSDMTMNNETIFYRSENLANKRKCVQNLFIKNNVGGAIDVWQIKNKGRKLKNCFAIFA